MQNITFEEKDGKLILTIDLNAKTTPSASGKTQIVASSKGNQPISTNVVGTVYLGVNIYKK